MTVQEQYLRGASYKFEGGEVVMYKGVNTALISRDGKTYKVANVFRASHSLMFDVIDVEGTQTSHTFIGNEEYKWDGDTASILWESIDLHYEKLAKNVDVERAYQSLARFL